MFAKKTALIQTCVFPDSETSVLVKAQPNERKLQNPLNDKKNLNYNNFSFLSHWTFNT